MGELYPLSKYVIEQVKIFDLIIFKILFIEAIYELVRIKKDCVKNNNKT